MSGASTTVDPRARSDAAAQAVAEETLLNCYLRDGGAHRFIDVAAGAATTVAIALPDGRELRVGVHYRSPTHRHRFALPATLVAADGTAAPVALDTLAELLVDALAAGDPCGPGERAQLLERIGASAAVVGSFLRARDDAIDPLWSAAPLDFIAGEQALLLGHMLHPTPKSRGEMTAAEIDAYSPETAARFALQWLAVDPALVEHDSAVAQSAPALVRQLLRADPSVDAARLDAVSGRVLLPAHPWELSHLRQTGALDALLHDGSVIALGELGAPVAATTSLRTVYRPDWVWQLKFSLHVRVTNSMRVTLPKELRRAVEATRLLQTAVGPAAAAIAPRFVMLQDPAYLAVRDGDGLLDGLSVLLRENRWPAGAAAGADVSALTVLCQDHPYGGRSRLAAIVGALAARDGRTEADVAREWFARYCDVVLVSLIRLYLELGLCMEPHQQNTLLELDGGWPDRCVYRDSQGYFHREAAHDDLVAIIPGLGEDSESIFPEALADERLVYYPFLNNALGVVNALGVGGCVDEELLLADLRALLERERRRGGRYPTTLLDRLLDDPTWPCKANLRTRLHDLDELVGDISVQSVYVTIPNPLHPGA